MTSKFHPRISISSIPADIPLRSHYVPSFPPPSAQRLSKPAPRHQSLTKRLHYFVVFLSLITLIASLIILGCTATSLRTYAQTHLTSQWRLPLWPTDVDFRPTHALLGCSIFIVIISLISIVVALTSLSKHPLLALLPILSLLAAIATLITVSVINTHASHISRPNKGTLQGWTCRWQGMKGIQPPGFAQVCGESQVAFGMLVLVLGFEIVKVGVGAWLWVGSKRRKGDIGEMGNGKGLVERV